MKCAVEAALGPGGGFLQRFKAYGWYLDDLVLRRINDLPREDPLIQINTATVTRPYGSRES